MSAITERVPPPRAGGATMFHMFGAATGGSAYPVTSAPSSCSHKLIHAPLKPVCPVSRTRRPRQNSAAERLRANGVRLLLILPPMRFQNAQTRPDPPKSQRAAEPNLQIQEFAQAPQ